MAPKWLQSVAPVLSSLALGCWSVMFLAGTDVWHEAGRPDFWRREEPPYSDVRAFVFAFYGLLLVLTLDLIATAFCLGAGRRGSPSLARRSS